MSKTSGFMRVLGVMVYKDTPICIRQFGNNHFIWDIFFDNKFYSSFIEINSDKDIKCPNCGHVISRELNKSEIEEATKMCYAGAASTVDTLLGVELSETDESIVAKFESARNQFGVN